MRDPAFFSMTALLCVELLLYPIDATHLTMNTVSRPEGAVTNQPRAERSAALGWEIDNAPALKGRHKIRIVAPLQGFASTNHLLPGRRSAADATSLCPGLIGFGPFGAKKWTSTPKWRCHTKTATDPISLQIVRLCRTDRAPANGASRKFPQHPSGKRQANASVLRLFNRK